MRDRILAFLPVVLGMLVLSGLTVVVAGGPAAAVVPVVAVDSATGDENSVFRGTGDGFAPGSVDITVTVDGALYTPDYTKVRTADATGHFTWVWIWDQDDPFGTYTYTATGIGGATASTTFTITRNGSPPAPAAGTSLMFDAASAPTVATMQSWLASPYRTVGVYVPVAAGTDNRTDKVQANLTAPWVQQVRGLGYRVLPIYLGVQAPAGCQPRNLFHMSAVAAEAAQQGTQAAQSAASSVAALGVPASVPVVYDMEGYNAGCTAAVTAFLDAWTVGLHQAGRLSGVYGSQASTMKDLAGRLADAAYHQPDAVWVATDNRRASTAGFSNPPDGSFAGRRINQFHLDLDRSFGGVTIRVDESVVDDGVLDGTPPVAAPPAPVPGPTARGSLLPAVTLGRSVRATWSGTAAAGGVASYDVRVRTGTWRKPLSGPTYPAGLQGTTATSASARVKPGTTWCYAVRSRDRAGTTSGWSAESCTTTPLDDRALAARGWSRAKDRAAYLRTTTVTSRAGSTLRLPRVRTGRVGLVLAAGSRGAVRITLDGRAVGTVKAVSRGDQRVVWLPARKVRTGALVLTSTTGRSVRVDGVVLPAS